MKAFFKTAFSLGRLLPAGLALLLMTVIAVAATPGAHRALMPSVFGLHLLEGRIYSDSSRQADTIIKLVEKARTNTEEFYGTLEANPVIIVCTTKECAKRFAVRTRGIAYGFQVIGIGPEGVNEAILTHEIMHAELHKRMGYSGMAGQTIPAWFNEGLAVWWSKDPRFKKSFSAEEIAWVRQMKKRPDLGKFIKERDYIVAYGAAAAAVSQINSQTGREGLLRIIYRVTQNGENFEAVLEDEGV